MRLERLCLTPAKVWQTFMSTFGREVAPYVGCSRGSWCHIDIVGQVLVSGPKKTAQT